jgi:hypothetical protein
MAADLMRKLTSTTYIRILTGIIFSLFLTIVIYGTIKFPYGVREDGHGGFVDKIGNSRSKEDYDALKKWEGVYFSSWAVLALIIICLRMIEKESRKAKQLPDKQGILNDE